jgi:hypothetical protein
MLDEQVLADLDILDYLELFNSTVKAAELLSLSQSTCSRRYRSMSEALDLGFDRIDGSYAPQANFDVLGALREACQKLRVRRGRPRSAVGWQCGDCELPASWRQLPLSTMDTAAVLSLLDGRLLDLWLGSLFEAQTLLQSPLAQLRHQRIALGRTLSALPLLRLRVAVLAHADHPLQRRTGLTPDDLAAYPSPALSMGAAPLLNRHLQQHGLATSPYGPSDYDPQRWEAVAADAHTLVYATPQRMEPLARLYNLRPLDYDLGLVDVLALVGHRDVLADASFAALGEALVAQLRSGPLGRCPGLEWLP